MNRIRLVCIVAVLVGFVATASAQVVPGYTVETYATNVPSPVEIAFAPDGTAYVGNGLNLPDTPTIAKVVYGGAPVTAYGPAFADPDSTLFDPTGSYAPQPGSVLLASANVGLGGTIRAILPDQTSVDLIGPTLTMQNPNRMVFDSTGRLIIGADDAVGKVFASTGPGNLTEIITLPSSGASIALDSTDRIFVRNNAGTIGIYSSTGTAIDANWVTSLEDIAPMYFGPGNSLWGTDLYTLNRASGHLLRIDSLGNVNVIGTGFTSDTTDLTFGPDGYMYLSVAGQDKLIRIVPEPSALALLALGGLAVLRRR